MTDLISRQDAIALYGNVDGDVVCLMERRLYDHIVHSLRSAGWSRLEAEGEALEILERRHAKVAKP